MANIADKVAQIRQATYGKDVRESIASGIEAINTEVGNTTGRQNVIDSQEQTRINAESIRQTNESDRESNEIDRKTNEANRGIAFNTSEANRVIAFNTSEEGRQTTFNNSEEARNTEFTNNEIIREQGETTRQTNESVRQTTFEAMIHADPNLELIEARGSKPSVNARFVDIENDLNTIGDTVDNINTSVAKNTTDLSEITQNYNVYASTKVGDYYTVVDYKRADTTLYLKSTLSNSDTNGYYQTCTLDLYDALGTTIIKTTVWTLTYDADGKIITKVVA